MDEARTIPARTKREVRQRCGFGCVICGSPVYEYDHMDGFHVTGHVAERITLLCSGHHTEKTARRLPIRIVERHNAEPFNSRRRATPKRALYYDATEAPTLRLGDMEIRPDSERRENLGISVHGSVAFGVRFTQDGLPSLEADIRDMTNKPLLRITRGELRFAVSNWDVTFEGQILRVQSRARSYVLEVLFDPEANTVHILRGDFALHLERILIGADSSTGGVTIPHSHMAMNGIALVGGGIAIGKEAPGFRGIVEFPRTMGQAFGDSSVNAFGR